jgi:hypothetical protein
MSSGKYRLHSRKTDKQTGKRKNLGTSKAVLQRKSESARCSFSSGAAKALTRPKDENQNGRSQVSS